jgi:hypothetical protein
MLDYLDLSNQVLCADSVLVGGSFLSVIWLYVI